jgi:L-malate glycosyltransferase
MNISSVQTKIISNHRVIEAARRVRVLHLLINFESGGTERQAVELLKRIDANRFDVRLAVLRKSGPLHEEIESRFPSIPEFPLTSFYDANFLRQIWRLRNFLISERIEILHAHDFYSDMLGVVAARSTGVKVIASQRNLQQSNRCAHRALQRFISLVSHRMLVNSSAIRQHLISNWKAKSEKIVLVRNGVRDLSEFSYGQWQRQSHAELCHELGIDHQAKLIGCVANLRPVKGHCFLLEAAALVIREIPEAHFIFVGEGELRSELESQAKLLGISNHVHLMGHRPDAARLQTAFDLSVLTSLHEGLPNSIMEAMAAGVPVLATAVGGIPELIIHRETGYLVSAGDVANIAQGITTALRNERESASIAARGHHYVTTKFGMNRMVNEVEDLYDELAKTYRKSL